ncbi:hypothetical protein LNQ81_00160 [Myroides sp. M-43]|uniref:hypothetical protein n=1 Tax=Myroides oncorhynchi TaxID=2893756 RepID=UPI001E3E37D0|nr:hypothetical protein [Myroides oncorhynchi]MCC9041152.1 hypothetical protein [Myroides oncorhynchi]
MKENKIKSKLTTLLICIVQLFCFVGFSQVGIKTTLPNKSAELTLGSDNKAILFNRVELVDRNSPKPLSDKELSVGMIVFNTKETTELSEGFYFWSSDKKWNKLFMKSVPTRQSNYIDFLQTKSSITLTNPTVPFELTDLNYDYAAVEDGTVYLDYVLYSTLSNAEFVGATKTTFVCLVTDGLNNQVFKGAVVISPMMVESNTGSNSIAGKGNFFFEIKAGQTYKIRMTVVDNYTGKYKNLMKVRVGDFEWSSYKSHSSLKITFLSKPNM